MDKRIENNIFLLCLFLTVYGIIALITTTQSYPNLIQYIVWSVQKSLMYFVPLIIYLSLKTKNKTNNNKMSNIFISISIFSTILCIYFSSINQVSEWMILLTINFIILIKAKFSIFFSISFSVLLFYTANILFQLSTVWNVDTNFSSFTSWFPNDMVIALTTSILIIILYKLNIEFALEKNIILAYTFFLIVFEWVYFNQINAFIVRLMTFPFMITLTLIIYTNRKKMIV